MGVFSPDVPKNYPNPPYDRPDATVLTNHWAALASGLGGRNWVGNDDFRMWPAGDAAAPAYYTLNGSGATIARTGTGLGDTKRKVGDFAAKVTAAAAVASLTQKLIPSGASWTRLQELLAPGDSVSDFVFGVWLWASALDVVTAWLWDGSAYSYPTYKLSPAGVLSECDTYHPGDSGWWWLMGRRPIVSGASELTLGFQAAAGASLYVGASCVLYGTAFPFNHQPCELEPLRILFPLQGDLDLISTPFSTIGGVRVYADKPWIITETHLATVVGPTGQALIVDVNKNGSSMYSTRPQIAAGSTVGEREPEGTYANRCLARGDYLTADLDQKGSSVDGEDLTVQVRGRAYIRPQDRHLAPAEVGA